LGRHGFKEMSGGTTFAIPPNIQFSDANRRLFYDGSNDTSANCTAAFADREAQLFFHSDWNDQLNVNCYVVARHNHLNAFWKRNNTCHVSCTEVELWTVVGEEWCMAAAFFLVKDVSFCLELLVW